MCADGMAVETVVHISRISEDRRIKKSCIELQRFPVSTSTVPEFNELEDGRAVSNSQKQAKHGTNELTVELDNETPPKIISETALLIFAGGGSGRKKKAYII
ncbi:hypothetical protein F5146DRAFT_1002374 [Armillaria mellea]|nr:hypothetical protein F5146DRAFT_1002374 [Armillaria mellea]